MDYKISSRFYFRLSNVRVFPSVLSLTNLFIILSVLKNLFDGF